MFWYWNSWVILLFVVLSVFYDTICNACLQDLFWPIGSVELRVTNKTSTFSYRICISASSSQLVQLFQLLQHHPFGFINRAVRKNALSFFSAFLSLLRMSEQALFTQPSTALFFCLCCCLHCWWTGNCWLAFEMRVDYCHCPVKTLSCAPLRTGRKRGQMLSQVLYACQEWSKLHGFIERPPTQLDFSHWCQFSVSLWWTGVCVPEGVRGREKEAKIAAFISTMKQWCKNTVWINLRPNMQKMQTYAEHAQPHIPINTSRHKQSTCIPAQCSWQLLEFNKL